MIEVVKLEDISRYKSELIAIQQSAWGFSDYETEAHHLMTRVQKYGGLIQGLFVDGKLLGFTYAILGKWRGEYFIYSHQLAVMKECQSRGYGFILKKAQRQEVLQMGYAVIKWCFDPLESLNAFFNIHRLGAISGEYEVNVYGVGEHGLHEGLPTDRLVAEWHLRSDRVVARMERKYPRILESVPEKLIGVFTGEIAYIEIPLDIREIKTQDRKQALRWRMLTREQFVEAFRQGYRVEHVVLSHDQNRVLYKLLKAPDPGHRLSE